MSQTHSNGLSSVASTIINLTQILIFLLKQCLTLDNYRHFHSLLMLNIAEILYLINAIGFILLML